jgi:predicted MFS family arabinose efflux permease
MVFCRFGRKPTIILASFIFTVGAVIMGVSYSKEVLLVGRYVTSIIFSGNAVIIGVSYSKEVLLVAGMCLHHLPYGHCHHGGVLF